MEFDLYIQYGCGRCEYYQTPQCKVHSWTKELIQLRSIALECGLTEEFKWSNPCYTLNGKNVLMIAALKDHANISFFKGTLLKDPEKILAVPGNNSQADRQLRYTSIQQIQDQKEHIHSYIFEAMEIEKAGLRVEFKKTQDPMPDELVEALENDPELKTAFEALSPGRQRGYILHFSQPKNSSTRINRIQKWIPAILNGEGMHDGYKRGK